MQNILKLFPSSVKILFFNPSTAEEDLRDSLPNATIFQIEVMRHIYMPAAVKGLSYSVVKYRKIILIFFFNI